MNDKLEFTPNALKVLEKRYLSKDENGNIIETPQQLFWRVANFIAQADKNYGKDDNYIRKLAEQFYELMIKKYFMPNSPTLMNADKPLGQLSACFVIPIEDSMESIFEAIKSAALVHKTGGGTGFSFSKLRPKNSMVKTTGGVASGPVSFMRVFDAATQAVKQGGRRRGANMGILRVDHPDIEEFITCKEKEGQISNFNISVALTEEFMKRLERDEEYELIDPHTQKVVGKKSAQDIFDLIAKCAHKNGEPGVVFIDRINASHPCPHLGNIESTNPCGEQPLLPYESCNLGSINLAKMLKKDAHNRYEIDWDRLKYTVHLAVHFLDNVIDQNKFPLPQIEKATRLTRKIGLGIMGWATMLGYLRIPYDSYQALSLAKELMSFILKEARNKSIQLAKERGVFPAYKGSVYEKKGIKLRNATLTTIAPTGTISIIAGPTSSGIEPLFALCFYRKVLDGERLLEIDPAFEEALKEEGLYREDIMEKIASTGSCQNVEEIPQELKKVFKTALEIDPVWHVRMQAAFQEFTDNAVSKTINMPNSSSVEDIKKVYLLAYRLGCKGITVYREGSRQEQVLNILNKKSKKTSIQIEKISPRPRPEVLLGTTTKVNTGCGNLYVTINQDKEGKFFEVFTQMGKAGGCAASQLEAIGRLVSLALRSGIDVHSIIEQLRGIRCPSPSWDNGKKIFSCADAIAKVIQERLQENKKIVTEEVNKKESIIEKRPSHNVVGVCPDCGVALHYEEGCVVCKSCGYSRC